jgi:hypothetical protein
LTSMVNPTNNQRTMFISRASVGELWWWTMSKLPSRQWYTFPALPTTETEEQVIAFAKERLGADYEFEVVPWEQARG